MIPDYEKVLEAERDQDKQRYQAQSKAAQILAAVAGQPANALKLYLSIHIERVLRETDGNITKAAASLGIDRRTLQRKLRGYGIEAQ